jgi:hypothetical protein
MNRRKKVNQILKSRLKKLKKTSNKEKYISKAEREKIALAETTQEEQFLAKI